MLMVREGQAAAFPDDVAVFLVAAAYGQTPASVRRWPADDFARACGLLELTRP